MYIPRLAIPIICYPTYLLLCRYCDSLAHPIRNVLAHRWSSGNIGFYSFYSSFHAHLFFCWLKDEPTAFQFSTWERCSWKWSLLLFIPSSEGKINNSFRSCSWHLFQFCQNPHSKLRERRGGGRERERSQAGRCGNIIPWQCPVLQMLNS